MNLGQYKLEWMLGLYKGFIPANRICFSVFMFFQLESCVCVTIVNQEDLEKIFFARINTVLTSILIYFALPSSTISKFSGGLYLCTSHAFYNYCHVPKFSRSALHVRGSCFKN